MKKVFFAAAAFLISLAIFLSAFEIFVRLTWKNRPECIQSEDDPIYQKQVSGDRKIVSLIPGAEGCALYAKFRINSKGCRGPDYPEKKAGRSRILLIGDSFIYGTCLPESKTLSAALEGELMNRSIRADVINAGVPSYNIEQNVERTETTANNYQPDVVVLSFIFNDLDNNIFSYEYGIPPLLSSSGKDYFPRRTLLWKLSDLMLPIGIGRNAPFEEFRFALARNWLSYQYFALLLKSKGEKAVLLGRKLPFAQTRSHQTEKLIWDRVDESLREFKRQSDTYHFKPLLMIYMDFEIEGYPALRLKELAKENGVEVLDMTPIWGNYTNFLRKYSIGWDGHPNGEANRKAARTLANFMIAKNMIHSGNSSNNNSEFEKLEELTRLHDEKARTLRNTQLRMDRMLKDSFSSELIPSANSAKEDQWLYGWWPVNKFAWDTGGGRMMSGQGGFFLKVPQSGGEGIILEGYRIEKEEPFPKLGLTVFCEGKPVAFMKNIPNREFALKILFRSKIIPSSIVECEIFSSRVSTPDSLGFTCGPDGSLVSIAFTRIAVF